MRFGKARRYAEDPDQFRVAGRLLRHTYGVCILVAVAEDLGFDWDKANTEHIAKHDVSPDEVTQVFAHDEVGISYDVVGGEERWTVVGETDEGRVLVIVYAMRKIWFAWLLLSRRAAGCEPAISP